MGPPPAVPPFRRGTSAPSVYSPMAYASTSSPSVPTTAFYNSSPSNSPPTSPSPPPRVITAGRGRGNLNIENALRKNLSEVLLKRNVHSCPSNLTPLAYASQDAPSENEEAPPPLPPRSSEEERVPPVDSSSSSSAPPLPPTLFPSALAPPPLPPFSRPGAAPPTPPPPVLPPTFGRRSVTQPYVAPLIDLNPAEGTNLSKLSKMRIFILKGLYLFLFLNRYQLARTYS